MGCCLSSSNRDPHHQNASNHRHPPSKPPPTPPQLVEEESVKEVLSETPVPRQQICVPNLQHKCTQTPSLKECEIEVNAGLSSKQEEEDSQAQVSQFSGMCSSINSDTLSMATTTTTVTTVTENREDEAMSKRVNRSPIKVPRKRPHTGELGGYRERAAKSPARRGNPPARSGQVGSRPVRGRELSGQGRNTQRSVTLRSSEVRRDSCEGPGRRSRSPATRKASEVGRGGGGGSPMRRAGRAGGMRLVGAGLEVEDVSKQEENGPVLPKQGNESLDNPLVSLECFIFL
ncbi:serine/arginine repetitive matrix protein 1 [Tripterygium wilfordii]|uniref:Serine/arginine repetitive matrix protein 1 n=1 Tax=Tripterygium wilfordii TaxID=458696 RepID=A0A7J7DHZ5_TRIWF|nr:serine/arginine repetitive matrix protein 1 [Tripterygium wilfordii]